MRYVVAILALAIGVAGVVAGEADDSPGLQLLGALFVVGAVWLGLRIVQRSRSHVQLPALSLAGSRAVGRHRVQLMK